MVVSGFNHPLEGDRGNNKGSHVGNTLVNPPAFVAGQPTGQCTPPPENYSKALGRVC